ncbi:MAG: NAD(P)-binding domain-containing protein, partial [Azonexus sp.]
MSTADIGVIGLGVMGVNLALNLSDKGFRLGVYNRTMAVTTEFVAAHGQDRVIAAADSPEQLVSQLAQPRIIL